MTDIASLFVWRRLDVLVAAITGEVDISNARSLERQITAELDAGADALVLDLAGLTFIDGSGVHLLFALSDRVRRLAVVLPDGTPPRRVLDLAGRARSAGSTPARTKRSKPSAANPCCACPPRSP